MNCWPEDPTHGFTELPLNTSNYQIQKPYNLPLCNRYSFVNGVHKLWVYSTDKPLSKSSPTKPRTEISITGYNYSSNVWQFEGYGYVPCGTSGVCIMQVLGASPPHATTLQLRIYIDGTLKYEAAGRGGNSYHFKFGVYGQINESYYMESRWKDIKVLKKCD
ncbi:hypothetical protein CISIN_1g048505mg [Citrus sinensis]|uniref:Alginate lyase 2 domain-containing protein n=1 Tax=Citrus sinensis TaxID=2711 RepID=A0A067EHL1_CITSI|nr:hypothetical protein CISIN_1g048505mg [Citrus sinensis]